MRKRVCETSSKVRHNFSGVSGIRKEKGGKGKMGKAKEAMREVMEGVVGLEDIIDEFRRELVGCMSDDNFCGVVSLEFRLEGGRVKGSKMKWERERGL